MVATDYTIVSPDQVQAGDIYKFIPAMDGAPALYADVLQVLAARNLVQCDGGTTIGRSGPTSSRRPGKWRSAGRTV